MVIMVNKLSAGDKFPELSLAIAGADKISLPSEIDSPLQVVLFYRGHW